MILFAFASEFLKIHCTNDPIRKDGDEIQTRDEEIHRVEKEEDNGTSLGIWHEISLLSVCFSLC